LAQAWNWRPFSGQMPRHGPSVRKGGLDASCWRRGSVAPVMLACDMGDVLEVRRLVADGADVNHKHPPNCAHGTGRRSIEALGSPAFNAGTTPLMCACRSGHLEVASVLLDEMGADVAAQDMERWNALHYACFSGHSELGRLLLDRGCPSDVTTKFEKATPEGFARHRRFTAACEACGRFDAPVPLSEEEAAPAFSRCEEKRARAEAAGEPLLHRYELTPSGWAELRRFLLQKGVEDVVLTACDVLTGLPVTMRWSSDHLHHLEEAKALRSQGSQVLRASSVSAVQHFLVLPQQQEQ